MEKNANTFFPDDRVVLASSLAGGKTASSGEQGTVVGADPTSGTLKVSFDDGQTRYVPAHELHKV